MVGAAALSGALLAAAFPKMDAWYLAWVALVPLILVARAGGTRAAAGHGYLAGLLFFGVLIEWIRLFDTTGWVLAVVILAGYVAAFAALVRLLSSSPAGWRAVLLPAAAWTALEWVRGLGPAGFTWGGLAYSLHDRLPLMQLASVAGPYGLTFLLVAANAAVAALAAPLVAPKSAGPRQWMGAAGRLALGVGGGGGGGVVGRHRLAQPVSGGEPIRVALLQGNVGGEGDRGTWDIAKVREAADVYLHLTEQAAAAHPDIVIWPESAVPGMLLLDHRMRGIREDIAAAARRFHLNLVVGSAHENPDGGRLNSAFLFARNGAVAGRYDKVHLVPYGEFTPWRRQLGVVYRHFPVIDLDFSSGAGFAPLKADAGALGVAICFESAFPGITRALRLAGSQVLAVTTNDAWFYRRAATWQHYDMSPFRAVESGAPLLRATTTGFSAVLDPYGREVARTGLFTRGVLLAEVRPAEGLTPYVRYGDVIAWLSALWVAGLCVAYRLRRR